MHRLLLICVFLHGTSILIAQKLVPSKWSYQIGLAVNTMPNIIEYSNPSFPEEIRENRDYPLNTHFTIDFYRTLGKKGKFQLLIFNRFFTKSIYEYEVRFEKDGVIHHYQQYDPSPNAIIVNCGIGYKFNIGKKLNFIPALTFPVLGFGLNYSNQITHTTYDPLSDRYTFGQFSSDNQQDNPQPFIGGFGLAYPVIRLDLSYVVNEKFSIGVHYSPIYNRYKDPNLTIKLKSHTFGLGLRYTPLKKKRE